MPSLPQLHEPLSDGVLALRPLAERDIPEILIAHQDDEAMHGRLGMARPPSGAELGRQCEEAEADRRFGMAMSLTITRAGEDSCVGQVTIHGLEWEQGRGELGIWLAHGARGRGWAPRALRLAARWLFDAARLARLEVYTDTANEPMLAAARSAGFAREGVLRGYALDRGRRVDEVVLGLLPEDL